MSGKERMIVEDFETVEDKQNPTQKVSWNHLEEVPENEKTAREPYWDTPYVIGASRNLLSNGTAPSEEKPPRRPGFWKRRWRYFRRYWILYGIAGVVLLAVGLLVL